MTKEQSVKNPEYCRQTYWEGWKLYPWSFVGHHVFGFIAALVVLLFGTEGMVVGTTMVYCFVQYQNFSQRRKGDAGGIDVRDLLSGYCFGALVVLVYVFFQYGVNLFNVL